MKTKKIAKKSKRKTINVAMLTNLELILKEFELAYNLSSGITNTMKNELRREFSRILGPVKNCTQRSRRFSFDIEKSIAFQGHIIEA